MAHRDLKVIVQIRHSLCVAVHRQTQQKREEWSK